MADRVHAVVFNELTRALSTEDRFVPLTGRERITARIVKAATPEILRETLGRADAVLVDTKTFHRLVQVAAHVSRGRQAADVGVYPDALARMALGALPDEFLRAALPKEPS